MKILLALLPALVLGCHSKEAVAVPLPKAPQLMAATIPPIDAAAPTRTQTATFALG